MKRLSSHLSNALDAVLKRRAGLPEASKGDPVADYLHRVVVQMTGQDSGGREGAAAAAGEVRFEDSDRIPAALRGLARLQSEFARRVLSDPEQGPRSVAGLERILRSLEESHQSLVETWIARETDERHDLVARVFHDLRSPLTSILFLSDALQAGGSGALSQTQMNQIRLIYGAALTLHTLVDSTLSSRALEISCASPQWVPFSIEGVSAEIDRSVRPLAEMNGLDLRMEQNGVGSRVGDPQALRRILLNLVTNAIDNTEEGRVRVIFEDDEDGLVVSVEDTGRGMNVDSLASLLSTSTDGNGSTDVDSGGDRSRTRPSGGGLGLSICHRLCRLVGGEISVESEIGHGTRFEVRLPFMPVDGPYRRNGRTALPAAGVAVGAV